jgi:hypothetical protein
MPVTSGFRLRVALARGVGNPALLHRQDRTGLP